MKTSQKFHKSEKKSSRHVGSIQFDDPTLDRLWLVR
jgi:hypothetical protein